MRPPCAEISIAPLEGIVPAMSNADILIEYNPIRFATARTVLRLSVSQFNFEPMQAPLATPRSAPRNSRVPWRWGAFAAPN